MSQPLDLCQTELTEIEKYLLGLSQREFYERLKGLFIKCSGGVMKDKKIATSLSPSFWIDRYGQDFPDFNYPKIFAFREDLPDLYLRLSIEGLHYYQSTINVNNNNLKQLQETIFGLSSPYYISNLSEETINRVLSAERTCGCFILRITTTKPWYEDSVKQFVITIRINQNDRYVIEKYLLQHYHPYGDTRVAIKFASEIFLEENELNKRIGKDGTEAMNNFLSLKYKHYKNITLSTLRTLILLGKINYNPLLRNEEIYNNTSGWHHKSPFPKNEEIYNTAPERYYY